MRKEKELIAMLRGLVNLLADEANRNPEFADRLEGLLTALPDATVSTRREPRKNAPTLLPDLYAENAARSEADFLLWLGDLPVSTLRSLIHANDFDPTRRTSKWNESEKLATFITDSLRARMARGSAFMGRGQPSG